MQNPREGNLLSGKPDDAFKDSDALHKLAFQISLAVPELYAARSANWKAFYSKNEPEHIGGKCRKLDGAVRHQTGLDFFVLIHLSTFAASDDFHKFRMICHELFHIEKLEKGGFVVRRHEGDFCEIAAHDKFSYRLALKAMGELGVKYSNLDEIRKYAHIDRIDSRNRLTSEVVITEEEEEKAVRRESPEGRLLPLDPDR